MPFIDLFSDQADLYATARPHYPEPLFQFIAAAAPGTRRAWDCGTGNGQAAVALARYFKFVSASDASAQQISHALACKGVDYSTQAAESTNYPDAAFDAVCVAQALHWFDFPRFFAEVQRVLKPDGLFIAWGYNWFNLTPEFDATLDECILKVIENDWAPQNRILWNGYRDVPLPFPAVNVPRLNMEMNWNFQQLLAYIHSWSATRRCMERIGTGFFTRAEAALLPHWGAPDRIRQIVIPLEILAGRRPP